MPPSTTAKTLSRIVADDPALAAWNRRRTQDAALLAVVAEVLPRTLTDEIAIADAASGELVIAGSSGAVAAVVRQRTPELRAALANKGWDFTAIRVVVQPRIRPAERSQPLALPLDAAAIPALSALADRLPHGPLRDSVQRLIGRRRR
jgi:hypothetical protein